MDINNICTIISSCRIITALDFDNINKAKELVNKVGSNISYYKVGLELFVSSGPAIIFIVLLGQTSSHLPQFIHLV